MADTPFPINSKDPAEAIKQMLQLIDELYQERIAGANVGDVFQISEDDVLTLKLGDNSGLSKTGCALSLNTGFGLEINANVLRVIAATFLQAANNLSDLGNKDTARSNLEVQKLVDRGDPAAHDFATGDFTHDGAAHDLDLSAIIPVGTKMIMLRARVTDPTAGLGIYFYKTGNLNVYNIAAVRTQEPNVINDVTLFVYPDSDRKVTYNSSLSGAGTLYCLVRGWWV
ncbi:MAG: hypothetical protein ABIJ57_01425 [Pseudomonadota bacterium]